MNRSVGNFYNEVGVLVFYISTNSNIFIFWVNVPKNVIKMSPPVNAWVIVPQGCKKQIDKKIMPGYPASRQIKEYWLILHANKDQQVQSSQNNKM